MCAWRGVIQPRHGRLPERLLLLADALGYVTDDALPHLEGGGITLRGGGVIFHLGIEAEVFRLRHRRQVHYNSVAHDQKSDTGPVRVSS